MVGKRLIRKITPESYRESYVSLVKLGLPVLVTQLGVILVNFADTMMVGAYGLDESRLLCVCQQPVHNHHCHAHGLCGGVTP